MKYDWRIVTAVVVVAVLAGWLLTRSGGDDADTADIDRDLAELVQALRADQTIDGALLLPAIPSGSFPGTFEYRRPAQFWQPAMGSDARRERPQRRRMDHE